jgi:hypothetical protein
MSEMSRHSSTLPMTGIGKLKSISECRKWVGWGPMILLSYSLFRMTAIRNYFRYEMNSHNRPKPAYDDSPLYDGEYNIMNFDNLPRTECQHFLMLCLLKL